MVPAAGKVEMVFTPATGGEAQRYEIFNFEGPGIAMGMYNTDKVSPFSINRIHTTILLIIV